MSANVYMQIMDSSGTTIKGSSSDGTNTSWIEVVSWSHGFSQPTTATTKSSDVQATSRCNHMNFSFTKFMDAASNSITKACWNGQLLQSVTVQCFRSTPSSETTPGAGATDYLTILMKNVIIANYSISGGGDELPIEHITLDYAYIKYTHKTYDGSQKALGGDAHISHDLQTNTIS